MCPGAREFHATVDEDVMEILKPGFGLQAFAALENR